MMDAQADRDPLEELAAEFVERHRRGESPSVSEYVVRCPELAEEIRDLFPTILSLEQLKMREGSSAAGRTCRDIGHLERLGDFRIIREIGRGGMGIVYEAEQESLGRRVAIKVLPYQGLLEAKHLARFRREARIAARLHHTNIVQVFGVGQQDGLHYYVMQYVPGVGLDRIIRRLAAICAGVAGELAGNPAKVDDFDRERIEAICRRWLGTTGHTSSCARTVGTLHDLPDCPDYFRTIAQLGIRVAHALHYAHSQGTMHRDIKPANLLVDPRGTVWVTDFGLAQAVHAEDITLPGEITGTLRFMPPERFGGQIDARGDIYSLGLTLYELLTLQPAFQNSDHTRLIHQITQSQPPRPGRINPRIPRDLETIILKATAHQPDHRYSTAAALAEDLQRFIEDRPIQARPARLAERLWRWSRRNPAMASLAATSLVLLLAVAVVANIGYFTATRALRGEAQQRDRAESIALLAQEALDRVIDRMSPSASPQVTSLSIEGTSQTTVQIAVPPVVSKEAAALLEEMLPFYDRLAERTGGDVALQLRSADANRRLADIRQRLGQYDKAVVAYRKAIELYQQQPAQSGNDVAVRIASVYNELGHLYRSTSQPDQARRSHMQALSILEPIVARKGSVAASARFELARTCYFLGTRIPDQAAPRAPHPPPPPDGPPDGPGPRPLGPGMRPPMPPPAPDGPQEPPAQQRHAYLGRAIDLINGLVAESSGSPQYRRMLALCHRDQYPDVQRRDPQKAAQSLDQATKILEQLVEEYPQMPDYRFDLCQCYAMVDPPHRPGFAGGPPVQQEPLSAIEQRLGKALDLARSLSSQYPQTPEYLALEAQVHHKIGGLLRQTRHREQAEQSDRQAVTCQEALVQQVPEVAAYKVFLAAFRNSLADILLVNGKVEEARQQAEQAIATLDNLMVADSEAWYLHGPLINANRTLAEIHHAAGHDDLAARARQEANRHRQELDAHAPPRLPDGP